MMISIVMVFLVLALFHGEAGLATADSAKETVHAKGYAYKTTDINAIIGNSTNIEVLEDSKKPEALPSCETMIGCADTGDDGIVFSASDAPLLRGLLLMSSLNNSSTLYIPESLELMDKAPLKNLKPPRLL